MYEVTYRSITLPCAEYRVCLIAWLLDCSPYISLSPRITMQPCLGHFPQDGRMQDEQNGNAREIKKSVEIASKRSIDRTSTTQQLL